MNTLALGLSLLCSVQVPALAQTPAVAQATGDATESARRLVATLSLASQEYRLAFQGGQLVNAAEWDEAKLFVAAARQSARSLPGPLAREMEARLGTLEQRLAARMPAESLASEATAVEARLTTVLGVSLDERPGREPSLAAGERLFRARCASCHGDRGRGDGVAARGLNPPPADLTDSALLASSVPLDVYRKVTHGVPGTAMPAFADVSREDRWDVVSYVFSLTDPAVRGGRSGQLAVVFGTVRGTLGGALELTARGEQHAAARKVLDAYMAFEVVEGALGATEPTLVARAEEHFTTLRLAAGAGVAVSEVHRHHAELLADLRAAEAALTRGRSPAGLFAESLLLILREGFEAILVIGAIMAVLLKAGATRRQRDVRWGVAGALVASLATAAALEWIFRVTPAQREALEGGVMLLAAAVLFYVSYWLISKVEIAAWTRFVKGRIQRAVESGSGFALGGVAFLAVYREGFETVLFYKALYVTGAGGGAGAITGGLVAGLALLVMVFVGIERFGLRIPMRPFFAVTGTTLAWMAFVFAGRAVKELQEGGYVPSTLVPGGPRNEFLGMYPTWESLSLQAVILLAMLGALVWTFVVQPRRFAHAPRVSSPASPAAPAPAPDRKPVGV